MGESSASQQSSQTTVSTTNAPATGGSQSPVNTTGTQYNLGSNARFDASPLVIKEALDTVQSTIDAAISAVRKSGSDIASNNDANNAAQAALLSQVLGASQAQSAAVSTGGQTEQNKTILYVVGSALAAIVLFAMLKK